MMQHLYLIINTYNILKIPLPKNEYRNLKYFLRESNYFISISVANNIIARRAKKKGKNIV